ncbi:MAG: hypothetical protein KTR16_01985 [Acidiferrobacterales bacterium]|nr:hypothetical protein [Acidiferrobacterales bacterium]
MGFKAVKRQVISCLRSGLITHQVRGKNLFATGAVTAELVEKIICRTDGDCYESSPHHLVNDIDVHLIKTRFGGLNWYIKWYCLEPNSVFISVHN